MGETKIEWATHVWNPVTGCSPISAGCDHCYAARMAKRLAGRVGYPADDPFKVTLHPERLEEPLHWKKPRRVFVCSMGDLFHEAVSYYAIERVFGIMRQAPQHTFLVLTKRPRMARMVLYPQPRSDIFKHWPFPNVWLGVSVEDQATADERIPALLRIPAAKRFVSCEPLLGPVSLARYHWHGVHPGEHKWRTTPSPLDWVIAGGETGPGARPMHSDWVRRLRDECKQVGSSFFFKSWGDWMPHWGGSQHLVYRTDGTVIAADHEHPDAWKYHLAEPVTHCGKKHSGRLLDGREWNERPEEGSR